MLIYLRRVHRDGKWIVRLAACFGLFVLHEQEKGKILGCYCILVVNSGDLVF